MDPQRQGLAMRQVHGSSGNRDQEATVYVYEVPQRQPQFEESFRGGHGPYRMTQPPAVDVG